jgi:ABC-type Fe3+/spermidine/putrescine transport system ATPase subunit
MRPDEQKDLVRSRPSDREGVQNDAPATPAVELIDVSKRYGRFSAVRGIHLSIAAGELLAVIGPSGAGKSTLIRLVSGEERPSAGAVRIRGRDVTRLPPPQRNVAVVYQDYSLFPHMSVSRNVAFPIEAQQAAEPFGLIRLVAGQADGKAVSRKIECALATVNLNGFADRMPDQLSGGEKQRAAIARALAMEPELICFDEPFSALDRGLRRQLRETVSRLKTNADNAFIYVTHNVEEAFALADRLAVLIDGEIAQIDRPRDLYFKPSSRRVAELTGDCRFFTVAAIDKQRGGSTSVRTAGGLTLDIPVGDVKVGDQIGIRPEIVSFDPHGAGLRAILRTAVFEGPHSRFTLALNNSEEVEAILPSHLPNKPEVGTELFIHIEQANCFVVA